MRLAAIVVALLVGVSHLAEAQVRADAAIRRAGVEDYFSDSLNASRQRLLRDATVDTVDSAALLAPEDVLITSVGTRPRVEAAGSDLRVVLPIRAFGSSATGEAHLFRPVVIVEGGGLTYDFDRRVFDGTLRVGLDDSLNTASGPVPPGLRSFFIFGDVDSIIPADVTVERSQLPYEPVSLIAAPPRADSVQLQIRTNLGTDQIPVPVNRVDIELVASPVEVQGFGLESAAISIGPVSRGGGMPLQLATDRGNLSATLLQLDANGAASTELRSSGVGTATISLTSPVFRAEAVSVRFVFPFLFLGAALLGGLVGGGARGITKDKSVRWPHLVGGLLFGLIAAVAYAVGINLVGVEPAVTTGQAVVFVLSAIGGFAGAPIVEQFIPAQS